MDATYEDTIARRLEARAGARPSAVALRTAGGEALTFSEWLREARAVAGDLDAPGVGCGDRVVMRCGVEDWVRYATDYVGVQLCGATVVLVLRAGMLNAFGSVVAGPTHRGGDQAARTPRVARRADGEGR